VCVECVSQVAYSEIFLRLRPSGLIISVHTNSHTHTRTLHAYTPRTHTHNTHTAHTHKHLLRSFLDWWPVGSLSELASTPTGSALRSV
jgi:hypothetical protein